MASFQPLGYGSCLTLAFFCLTLENRPCHTLCHTLGLYNWILYFISRLRQHILLFIPEFPLDKNTTEIIWKIFSKLVIPHNIKQHSLHFCPPYPLSFLLLLISISPTIFLTLQNSVSSPFCHFKLHENGTFIRMVLSKSRLYCLILY